MAFTPLLMVPALPGPPMRLSEFIACIIALGFGGAVAYGVYLYAGYRQFRDGRGSLGRYLLVAAAMTPLSLLPACTALLLAIAVAPRRELLLPAMLASTLCIVALARFLHPPGYWKLTGKSLDEVRDPGFLARVDELARRVGVRTPVVRLFPSLGGDMLVHAAAGGLPAPSLVVSDGILHRLTPAERDAVVAHELAHIRNGSLWQLALTAPVAGIAAVLAAGVLSEGTAVAFGVAIYVGLYRIVCRRLELDCDRRAGEANGYATTFSALAKIHAILPLHNTGLRSLLLYATATHPSRDERLAALARRMSEPPPQSADWSPRAARRRRAAAWLAAAVWMGLLVACVIVADRDSKSLCPLMIALAVIVAPFAFQLWAVRAEFRQAARRQQSSGFHPRYWGVLFAFIAGLACLLLYLQYEDAINLFLSDSSLKGMQVYSAWLIILLAAGVVAIVLLIPRWQGIQRIELQIATALQQHDWRGAIEAGERWQKQVVRSPAARHNLAIAKLKLGRWEEAVADLQKLRGDDRTLKQTWVTLGLMHFEEERADLALAVAHELQRDSKRDPAGFLLANRALRELGRLDEAEQELEHARRLAPDDGAVMAGESMLRLARGDIEGAQKIVAELERRSPGDAILPFVEAEIAFAAGDLNSVRRHIERAAELVRVNPFTLSEKRLARLQARLAHEDRSEPLDILDWIDDDAAVPRDPVS